VVPPSLVQRVQVFNFFTLDELGFGILWIEGIDRLKQPGGGLDLKKPGLSELSQANLQRWVETEEAHGFPRLNAHRTVSIWSALDAVVEDIFVLRLRLDPELLLHENSERRKSRWLTFSGSMKMDDCDFWLVKYRTCDRDQRLLH
jgi:hypothetical protein